MRKLLWAITVFGLTATLGLTSCKKEQNSVTPSNGTTTTQPSTASDYEKQELAYLREEEKMARDVYIALYTKWPNLNFFSNISSSEQKHMDKVLQLLNTYGLPDPVGTNGVGVFANAEIQTMYNSLVAKGEVSEIEAIKVGLTIEDVDIYDIQQALTKVEKQDIKTVFGNLMKASKNHMREFHDQLTSRGGTYTPQYISQQEYDQIVNSPKEHGSEM
ncbi:MAG: DUF2202 domain-containing protein [Chitinophagales bacterium]|nr:DUF2202 domain-containing protein [Chitinophagaceae bacterium]MCB9064785.1 DUF2202 domain-containing protein [Chitinophagales bacterium]